MSCYYHTDREPIGTCPICNKQLCKDCFELTVGHICFDCSMAMHSEAKKNLIVTCIIAILSIIAFFVGVILMNKGDNMLWVGGLIYLIACIVPAWRFLGWLANKMFGPREYFGYMILIAFIIKLILAIFISLVVPFVYIILLIIAIVRYVKINKDMKLVKQSHLFITTE
ncbi:MAG: hypothetical protein K5892_00410 [Acholeplasmatales bacterium]|nr:hypothetical protein [Acholeplasmatales bacterium]